MLCSAQLAAAVTLSNGSGDGTVQVDVGDYGQFSTAIFDPIGAVEAGGTTYYSSVYVDVGNGPVDPTGPGGGEDEIPAEVPALRAALDAPLISFGPATVVEQTETRYVTQFNINDLTVTLTQTLADGYSEGERTGSVLNQEFEITNTGDEAAAFDLYRYFDGDLYLTDNTLDDAGGVLGSGAGTVLYELDVLDGEPAQETFVGITAIGGSVDDNNRYAIDNCCGVNAPLDNRVTGDTNGDGKTDSAFDVTLTLRNMMNIGAGETDSYLTQTIFGTADQVVTPVETVAGETERNPLLPTREDGGSFEFVLTDANFENPEFVTDVIWIDPVVAVGYTYTVTGADFFSVVAPSAVAVPDADGYTLTFGGTSIALAAGATYTFAPGVQSFTISGIDAALMLDPTSPLAFPTGVSLTNFTNTSVVVTQTAIEAEIGGEVPLPASLWLLGGAVAGLGLTRRRRCHS